MKNPVIFISTIEFSGDMHGEVLVRELRGQMPEAQFYGIGGARLAQAGVELLTDTVKSSTIGFIEALKNLGRLRRLMKEIVKEWDRRRPDLMVWLDSGAFNQILAKEAKERGIPVVCMFSPSAWAYGQERAVKLAQRVNLLLAILPFEAGFYRKFGAKAEFIGHPLVDRVKNDLAPADFKKALGIKPEQKVIALMPGSRRQEVARLLPAMLEAGAELAREYPVALVLPVASSIDRAWLDSIRQQYPVDCIVTDGGVYNLLAAADAGVIASGTATMEAALMQVPMVIVYQVSKLSYWIYKRMESPEHKGKPIMFGMPNIIMDRKFLPELIFEDLNARNIFNHLKAYLEDPVHYARVKQDLAEVKARSGEPGVMTRAAKYITELLQSP